MNAVLHYTHDWVGDDTLVTTVPVMATHIDRQGDGLAKTMLGMLDEAVLREARLHGGARIAVITAEVHVLNKPCQSLIAAHGWNRGETSRFDVHYEEWTVRLQTAPVSI